MTGPQPELSPIDSLGFLHNRLKRALLASTDPAATETMRQADAVIVEAITALNQTDFQARTAEFKELGKSLNSHVAKLTELKASLDSIIADIQLATEVTKAIDAAASAVAKAFPAL